MKIRFKSRPFQDQEVWIYSLLCLPNKPAPGFVFLPAGEATKESRKKLLIELAKEGYASHAIDQRGLEKQQALFYGFGKIMLFLIKDRRAWEEDMQL